MTKGSFRYKNPVNGVGLVPKKRVKVVDPFTGVNEPHHIKVVENKSARVFDEPRPTMQNSAIKIHETLPTAATTAAFDAKRLTQMYFSKDGPDDYKSQSGKKLLSKEFRATKDNFTAAHKKESDPAKIVIGQKNIITLRKSLRYTEVKQKETSKHLF